MVHLTQASLERLRDSLRARGARASVVLGSGPGSIAAADAMQVVSEYGALSEAMFLIMFSDRKVKNIEREVLRGALRILSADSVRSAHIESMLDVASRNVAEEGFDARLTKVIDKLREDTAKSELAYVLGVAVAAADGTIVPEEQAVLDKLAVGLGIDEARVNKLLAQFDQDAAAEKLALPHSRFRRLVRSATRGRWPSCISGTGRCRARRRSTSSRSRTTTASRESACSSSSRGSTIGSGAATSPPARA